MSRDTPLHPRTPGLRPRPPESTGLNSRSWERLRAAASPRSLIFRPAAALRCSIHALAMPGFHASGGLQAKSQTYVGKSVPLLPASSPGPEQGVTERNRFCRESFAGCGMARRETPD